MKIDLSYLKKKLNLKKFIKLLNKSDRIKEIATLISGQKVTDSGRKQAKELLQLNG